MITKQAVLEQIDTALAVYDQHNKDALASISTVPESTNTGPAPRAPDHANRRRSCFPPNQGMGVGSSARPEVTR